MRLVLALLLASLPALAADPWEAPAFSAAPATVAGAAAALPTPAGAEVEVLLEEGSFAYDAQGRETSTSRLVYRVLTQEGAKSWASVGVGYSPWHEERPQVRARVITPDGKEHPLDPATLVDSTPAEEEPETLSDRRLLHGPLPAISEGAVVEQLITLHETQSLFSSGSARRFFFGKEVPVRRVRLTLEVPQGTPLHFVARGVRVKPRREEVQGRTRLVFEQGPLAPVESPEPFQPADAVSFPHVAFSTGRAWSDLAHRYHETVEAQLAGAELERTAKELAGSETRREVVVARLTKWVHAQVRYTSLQFGEAAVVPRQPAEVLKRRYGDCKDLSTLLVGLLRASGIPASVALLRTGQEDVQESLPGFGLFDHAIVYVPGKPALWIDATDAFSPPGELPVMVQGRLALVASPGTQGLVRTPTSSANSNGSITTREVSLSEHGASRIVEVKDSTGSVAAAYREHFALTESSRVREGYVDYVKSVFSASDVARLAPGEQDNLDKPFRVELEVKEASRGFTDDNEAALGLGGASLFGRLPDYLIDAASDERPWTRRQGELELLEPYTAELRYHVVAPPGYSPKPLPKDFTRKLGPATYSGLYGLQEREVNVTFRFDTGKRRWSASDVERFRTALQALREEEEPMLGFEHEGAALLSAGRVPEALEVYHRLVAQHPKEALHHSQLALALLEAGAGEEARAEARRATEVEPESSQGWRALGWVLQHDLLGRRFKEGFDYAGSLAAYRKAREIDPGDFETRGDLGILLEYDSRGERYGEGARLSEAVEEYQTLREDLGRQDMNDHLLLDLFLLERYPELLKLAAGMDASPLRNSLRLSASALVDGAAAAVKNAVKWVPAVDARRAALEDAATRLLRLRRYPEASALLSESARGADDAVEKQRRLTPLAKTVRFEPKSLKSDDPRSVVQGLFLAMLDDDGGQARLRGLMLKPALAADASLLVKVQQTVRLLLGRGVLAEVPPSAAVDMALALMELRVDGDAKKGYRVQSRLPLEGSSASEHWFVVRSGSELRLLGTGYDHGLLGQEAMRRAEAGDLEGARQWLDWARDAMPPTLPETQTGANFLRLWKKGAPAGRDEVRVAAASLMAFGEQAVRAIPFLSQAREKAGTDVERRGFDRDLLAAYFHLKRQPEVLRTADRLLEAAPVDSAAFFHATNALSQLERPEEMARRAEARLKLLPDDEQALETLASVAAMHGELAKAQEYRRRIVEAGQATAHTYNELAWNTLLLGKVDEAAVEDALKANSLTSYGNGSYVHTLATLYAELGKGQEARQLLLKSLELQGAATLEPYDWYVVGRIAEGYGLAEEARAAYLRAKSAKADLNHVDSLARARLEAMEAARRTVSKPAP
jgi:transglutaminase-like putative cysteine protease/tetratricopeptide (TPR) repeat protein